MGKVNAKKLYSFKLNCCIVFRLAESLKYQPSLHYDHLINRIFSLIQHIQVDIKFPSPEEAKTNPDAVTIIGKEEDVENAKEAILNMAEDYARDYLENLPPSPQPQTVGAFLSGGNTNTGNENGFVMKDAPWEKPQDKKGKAAAPNTQSQEDFPAVGGAPVTSAPMTSVWGPKN